MSYDGEGSMHIVSAQEMGTLRILGAQEYRGCTKKMGCQHLEGPAFP